jgi:uncharacterized protein (TIGR02265 family)
MPVLFQSLFAEALPQKPEFVAALREAGFGARAGGQACTVRQFAEGLEIARQHFYAHRSVEEAQRHLGELLVEGLARSTTGRVATATLGLFGPGRLPPNYTLPNESLRISPTQQGPRTWSLAFRGEPAVPTHFAAGAVAEVIRRCRASPGVEIEPRGPPGDFDLLVTW